MALAFTVAQPQAHFSPRGDTHHLEGTSLATVCETSPASLQPRKCAVIPGASSEQGGGADPAKTPTQGLDAQAQPEVLLPQPQKRMLPQTWLLPQPAWRAWQPQPARQPACQPALQPQPAWQQQPAWQPQPARQPEPLGYSGQPEQSAASPQLAAEAASPVALESCAHRAAGSPQLGTWVAFVTHLSVDTLACRCVTLGCPRVRVSFISFRREFLADIIVIVGSTKAKHKARSAHVVTAVSPVSLPGWVLLSTQLVARTLSPTMAHGYLFDCQRNVNRGEDGSNTSPSGSTVTHLGREPGMCRLAHRSVFLARMLYLPQCDVTTGRTLQFVALEQHPTFYF